MLVARGRFWDPPVDRLSAAADCTDNPDVAIIVPARNEAPILAATLPTLFAQQYAGNIALMLADDGSSDGTAARAHWLATEAGANHRFNVVSVPPRPAGWAGKVWAMAAAVGAVRKSGKTPAYWLFTDADIAHDPDVVSALVATARADRRDLVSLMVQLHCKSRWERLLIPAFVFFFAKLYPFAWVADDRRQTAAAAGGCLLISDEMLGRIGGFERISGALIDDCSLAAAVKGDGGRLRLELTTRARSVRPYVTLGELWLMVARSADTQLGHSPLVLAGTVAGMLLLYVLPPLTTVAGIARGNALLGASGALAWVLMSVAYIPLLRRYGQSLRAAPTLPLAAALYTLMTIDSALRYRRGRGGAWKGRLQAPPAAPNP